MAGPLDVLVGVSTPYGPLLTDDYGRSIRFAEYGDGPCRFGDRPIQVMKPYEWLADRVYVFDDEAVAPFEDDVARFVVEACRCFVGGDGDHVRSVVLCREGVAEQLDLTFWDDYDSAARDAYFARNGWRNYCVPGDTEILELCPACAVRALRRGETRGLADTWLRPTHAYTHAFREVDAQLSARERVVANLLLTEGRTA